MKTVHEIIRIVHTNTLWQDSEKWCNITIYDMNNNIIGYGHDIVEWIFKGSGMMTHCRKDVEGIFYYNAEFHVDTYHSIARIIVEPLKPAVL